MLAPLAGVNAVLPGFSLLRGVYSSRCAPSGLGVAL